MTRLLGSLRLRLLVLILIPLIVVSSVGVFWRYDGARATAEEIFDRSLVVLCMAVSRDVAYSGGDSLSVTTSNLFRDASGGRIFYHVKGPDGRFITGYSSPPVRAEPVTLELNSPIIFNAQHQGVPVRAVRLAERVEVDGITGTSVITVWQQLQPRQAFAQQLAVQTAIITAILMLTVAAVVLFGIQLGLRPLKRLEDAIQARSMTDLSPIVRRVPVEASGIVERLNALFGTLSEAHEQRERLISNTAHQLRNPVAAIHAMAQATNRARTLEDSKKRSAALVNETRQAVRLTTQMLSIERIKGVLPDFEEGDFAAFLMELTARIAPKVLESDVAFDVTIPKGPIEKNFDPTLMSEAITNLVDNALKHGGAGLTQIAVDMAVIGNEVHVSITNDGSLIDPDKSMLLFERFAQGRESDGAGLGLAIVKEVVDLHGGKITVNTEPKTRFEVQF